MNNLKKIIPLLLTIAVSFQCSGQELKRRAMLGIRMMPLSDSLSQLSNYTGKSGIYIDAVNPGGTLGKIGITSGSILQRINGETINTLSDVHQAISNLRADDNIKVSYFKDGSSKTITGRAIARPIEAHPKADVHYDVVAYKDNHLRSILYTPKKVEKAPVVFYLQGYTCQSIEYPNGNPMKSLIDDYIDAGFAVYMVEKPGLGDSNSKIPCIDIDFHQELEAFTQAYKALIKTPNIDADNIFLFGHSMGGVIAPFLAQELSPKGLITFGTVGKNWYDYMKDIFTEQQEIFNIPHDEIQENLKSNIPFMTDMMINKKSNTEMLNNPTYKQYLIDENIATDLERGYYIGRHYKFWASLGDIDIMEAWKNVTTNVLVMHGEYDIQAINKRYAEALVDLINDHKGRADFTLMKETDHLFLSFNSMQENVDMLNSGNYGQYMNTKENYNSEVGTESINWIRSTIN
ncbi:MAG: PDZ domain-containing protein [Chitinophagales bacterium]|nr:PDZ domain-containing protein [Chitinophagales bacterium]